MAYNYIPPYFVAGAIFSGFAMVQTLMLVARKVYGLENIITLGHIERMTSSFCLQAQWLVLHTSQSFSWHGIQGCNMTGILEQSIWAVCMGVLDYDVL